MFTNVEFKNFGGAIGTSATVLYTCPTTNPPTKAILLSLQAANVDGSASADITAYWTDDSDIDAIKNWAKTIPLAADTSIGLITGKPTLEQGDTVVGIASAAGDIEISGSVMELS